MPRSHGRREDTMGLACACLKDTKGTRETWGQKEVVEGHLSSWRTLNSTYEEMGHCCRVWGRGMTDRLWLESQSLVWLLFGKQTMRKPSKTGPSSSFSADWLGNFNSMLIDENFTGPNQIIHLKRETIGLTAYVLSQPEHSVWGQTYCVMACQ